MQKKPSADNQNRSVEYIVGPIEVYCRADGGFGQDRCPGVYGCRIKNNGRSELARCQWGDLLWETFCVMLCLARMERLLVEWVGALLPPNENPTTTNWAD